MDKVKRQTKRLLVGIGGGLLLVAGIIMIPYPGPGWLVVISALALLSTEFHWAKRGLDFVKEYYQKWHDWTERQEPYIRLLLALGTFLIVVATVWLVNGFGLWAMILHLDAPWMYSPFVRS